MGVAQFSLFSRSIRRFLWDLSRDSKTNEFSGWLGGGRWFQKKQPKSEANLKSSLTLNLTTAKSKVGDVTEASRLFTTNSLHAKSSFCPWRMMRGERLEPAAYAISLLPKGRVPSRFFLQRRQSEESKARARPDSMVVDPEHTRVVTRSWAHVASRFVWTGFYAWIDLVSSFPIWATKKMAHFRPGQPGPVKSFRGKLPHRPLACGPPGISHSFSR